MTEIKKSSKSTTTNWNKNNDTKDSENKESDVLWNIDIEVNRTKHLNNNESNIKEKDLADIKTDTTILENKFKKQILEKEEKRKYYSDKYSKIETKVKESLKRQDTDEWLRDVVVWAMVLWASDIHYDCYENYVIVRFRIDWILVDIFRFTHKEYALILERLKYWSWLKLNITNIPQDGKYILKMDDDSFENWYKKIDIRISTLPTKYWENIVSRILDSNKAIVDFEELWFFWVTKRMIDKAINKTNGMILVTGPTWSWKTTTLYTLLSKLNTREKKIITLEDPIEYELDWIIQSEVNDKNSFTFQTWLKALLRQDPDIIMVWEIRDKETLNTATSASLTGHLVLSTLHTKSAVETLDRIINMGLSPYILASALDTIIAQRLVRKICQHCKVEKKKTVQEIAMIKTMMSEIGMNMLTFKSMKLYKWNWCDRCNNSWYKWRIWIFEIISLNEELRDIIRDWASAKEITLKAKDSDFINMKEDGVLKAIKWYTTIEEILRVV